MKALVLGASGFIGESLVNSLLERDIDVLSYSRNNRNSSVKWIEGNFSKEENFAKILKDNEIDIVFHLVSTTVPSEDTAVIEDEFEGNVIPTLKLLEAMKSTDTKKMVFVSSGGTIYGEYKGYPNSVKDIPDPICSYGLQKSVIEQCLNFYSKKYGLDIKIARLSNPYGFFRGRKKQGIIPIVVERLYAGLPITIYGDTYRDYIHISDAIDALMKFSFDYDGDVSTVNIGTGTETRISDIVAMIEQFSGKNFTGIEYLPIRSCDVEKSVLDISETEKVLNWKPKTDIRTGIREVISEMAEV